MAAAGNRKQFRPDMTSSLWRMSLTMLLLAECLRTVFPLNVGKSTVNCVLKTQTINNRFGESMTTFSFGQWVIAQFETPPPLLHLTALYDTSSDSPSAKSNGVRWVSAIILRIRDKLNGFIKNIVRVNCWRGMLFIFIDDSWEIKQIRINDILTSYEILWANPRKAPSILPYSLTSCLTSMNQWIGKVTIRAT